MKAHVINCATIRLYLPPLEVATCCLVVESDDGLILIDTGMGTRDHIEPAKGVRMAKGLAHTFGQAEETAVNQITRLGYSRSDVRHMVVTHLHIDHAGGLPDFPEAWVHVSRAEYETAMTAGALRGLVYVADHWAHGPKWQVHDGARSSDWFGFRSLPVLELANLSVRLVSLPGHTRGHCGVAVGDGSQWLLHCGDAVTLDALESRPGSLAARMLGPNFERLRELAEEHDVHLLPSHVRVNKMPVLAGAG